VPEEDGDLLTELAREVLNEADLPDLQAMFADDMKISHNPMGSMITPSAIIVPDPKALTWDEWVTQKTLIVRKTKRKEVIPEGQIGLGI